MEITIGESHINFNQSASQVHISGSMRLPNMQEYEKVSEFLKEAASTSGDLLTIDLSGLKFLNSSGITTLSLFVIHLSKVGSPKIKIMGSKDIPWHNKSLNNFKKLWKAVDLEIK